VPQEPEEEPQEPEEEPQEPEEEPQEEPEEEPEEEPLLTRINQMNLANMDLTVGVPCMMCILTLTPIGQFPGATLCIGGSTGATTTACVCPCSCCSCCCYADADADPSTKPCTNKLFIGQGQGRFQMKSRKIFRCMAHLNILKYICLDSTRYNNK
jgi:hypothetical protein